VLPTHALRPIPVPQATPAPQRTLVRLPTLALPLIRVLPQTHVPQPILALPRALQYPIPVLPQRLVLLQIRVPRPPLGRTRARPPHLVRPPIRALQPIPAQQARRNEG